MVYTLTVSYVHVRTYACAEFNHASMLGLFLCMYVSISVCMYLHAYTLFMLHSIMYIHVHVSIYTLCVLHTVVYVKYYSTILFRSQFTIIMLFACTMYNIYVYTFIS